MRKVFLDANIILDLIDKDRGSVGQTKSAISKYIKNGDELFTSCDIFTTVYYVSSKKLSKDAIVGELEKILVFVGVLPIDMSTVKEALAIVKSTQTCDMEDVLQYVCALQNKCDLIVTNDKSFYVGEIEVVGTR
jgi:predicted nucleic acid-binding protein